MTTGSAIALFFTMLVLAAVPSTSVLIVVTRSSASGFIHGIYAALGIVCGDILFILMAIFGLSLLVDLMAEKFALLKYLGGAYLFWTGVNLWRLRSVAAKKVKDAGASLPGSFMSGFLFTMADQKAILFYLGLFPVFMDLTRITLADTGAVILITLVAVGGVKVAYAYLANRVVSIMDDRIKLVLNIAASFLMIGLGLFLVISA